MKAVTGQSEVMQLAEKIENMCREHTSSAVVARAALQIAEISIATGDSQSFEEQFLCEQVPKRLPSER